MRWLFFALCTLNVIMLVLQWSDARDLSKHERYSVGRDVRELRMVNVAKDSAHDSGKACTLVGPFESEDLVGRLRQSFKESGMGSEVIAQQADLAPAYWVYFSDFGPDKDVGAQLKEIKAKGMDAFIIASGELKGNISLGVFKNIDSARRMRNIAAKKGLKTELTEIKRSEEIYWLSVFVPYLVENKDKISAVLGVNNTESEMREFFCKSVASEK